MKKVISLGLAVVCLFLLSACGNKKADFIASGDEESLYPYGWYENKDGSVTVEIQGKWDKNCTWVPVYDELALSVTKDAKAANRFTVTGLSTGGSDVNFYLRRTGEESELYCLWIYFNSTPSGDITVLSCTHEEPLVEGSYTLTECEDGSLEFTVVSSTLSWQSRLIAQSMMEDSVLISDKVMTFTVRTDEADSGVWELWDGMTSRKVTIALTADADGVITKGDVEEGEDTSLSEAVYAAMEKALGTAVRLPDGAAVTDAALYTEREDGEFTYGLLDVTVDGVAYEYAAASDPDLKALFALGSVEDNEAESAVEGGTETSFPLSGVGEVLCYERSDRVSAVWKENGGYYALRSKDAGLAELTAAVKVIAGAANG